MRALPAALAALALPPRGAAEERRFAEDRCSLALEVEDLFPEIQDGLEIAQPVVVEGMALTRLPEPRFDLARAWYSGFDIANQLATADELAGQFRDQEATIKVGQSVVVRLPVTNGPKREYLWKLNATYDEDTFLLNRDHLESNNYPSSGILQFILENSGYVAPRNIDESAFQQLVFKGIQPGAVKLPFIYNRPWYNDLQPGGAATFVNVRVLPRRKRFNEQFGADGSPPATKTAFTVYKGQHLEIKLGNSPTQQYNLWKLMEIFDLKSGHILPGPSAPALLEFIFNESGYVPPVLNSTDAEATKATEVRVRSAGYQKFTVFARAPGRQVLHFAFLKPWLPDDQPDKTTAVIDITILDRKKPKNK